MLRPFHPALVAGCLALAAAALAGIAARSTVLEARPSTAWKVAPLQKSGRGPMALSPPIDPRAAVREGGRFRAARDGGDELAQLEAIGYLSGSREADGRTSVTTHDRERAWQGLNLVTSGHAAEAQLVDMDGVVVHTWRRDFERVWPDWGDRPNENMLFWRRVRLLPDGSLLAIYEGLGLIKLDRDSNLVWARPNAAHHDLEVLPDGDLLVLVRRAEMAEELDVDAPTLIDFVARLDPEGRELARVSLLTAYANSPFFAHYNERTSRGGDSFHTNSLRWLDGRHGAPFAEGNVLLSMRHLDTIAVLHPPSGRIVWSRKGPWRLQHDPRLLDNGNLLLFDNGPPKREASEVLELDARTGEVVWRYAGTEDDPFWSATCGTAHRLPNGNTLITESDAGRAFEVTVDGDIVWEYINPHRPADRPELVATLFEVQRLPADFLLDWLPAGDPR